MGMMMVVRAAPNTAGGQDENSEDPHKGFGQTRIRQYRSVLLIVVDDEEPEKKEAGQETASDPRCQMKVPDRSGHGNRQQYGGGDKMPPAPACKIGCVRFGCQNDFFACSYAPAHHVGGVSDKRVD
jgi:hypothetical protein